MSHKLVIKRPSDYRCPQIFDTPSKVDWTRDSSLMQQIQREAIRRAESMKLFERDSLIHYGTWRRWLAADKEEADRILEEFRLSRNTVMERNYLDTRCLRRIEISTELLRQLIRAELWPASGFTVKSDAPADLEVVAVDQSVHEELNFRFTVLVWSESFSPIPDGEEIPTMVVTFQTKRIHLLTPLLN